MTGNYESLERGQRLHAAINRRRVWNEDLNAEIVRLTGEPFYDAHPDRTTALYDSGVSAEEVAQRIIRQDGI